MNINNGWLFLCCLFLIGCGTGANKSGPSPIEETRQKTPAVDEFTPLDKYPEMIYEAQPVYPLLAVSSGVEGAVWVRALVNKQGKVKEAVIGKSSGFAYLDDAALKAAMKCKYKPGLQQGEPVTCWVTYKVEFNLNK